MPDLVHYAVDTTATAPIATVEIDSPHNRNALSRALLADLAGALSTASDDRTLHGVLITSSGPVFSSGADLAEAHAHGMLDSSTAIMAIQRQIAALGQADLVADANLGAGYARLSGDGRLAYLHTYGRLGVAVRVGGRLAEDHRPWTR